MVLGRTSTAGGGKPRRSRQRSGDKMVHRLIESKKQEKSSASWLIAL